MTMKNEGKKLGRTIYLHEEFWQIIDNDAKQSLRSSVKQIEAILRLYYNSKGNMDLNTEAINKFSYAMPLSDEKPP